MAVAYESERVMWSNSFRFFFKTSHLLPYDFREDKKKKKTDYMFNNKISVACDEFGVMLGEYCCEGERSVLSWLNGVDVYLTTWIRKS